MNSKNNLSFDSKKCYLCGLFSDEISSFLGICLSCLRNSSKQDEKLEMIKKIHATSRKKLKLPLYIPNDPEGIKCHLCSAECSICNENISWCGLRQNVNGKLVSEISNERALLRWYLDRHVTNCCNAYFCPAGTGVGFPNYANSEGPERGYYNMSVFMYGCSFNCLYCQNAGHKKLKQGTIVKAETLIKRVIENKKISCLCWFGGSPEPQMPFTINVSKQILEQKKKDRIVRICYEWNGSGKKDLVKDASQLAYDSGGNIKFDAKAFHLVVHEALTSMNNKPIFDNIKFVFDEFWDERSTDNPILGITTLLVPHYVDKEEVEGIAKFLAELDKNIPYSLLIFHPDNFMRDLPVTPINQVRECYQIAKKWLDKVNVGNLNLLGINTINQL